MKFFRLFPFLLIGSFVAFGSPRALAQDEAAPQKDDPSQQAPQLKAIKEPMVPYPEEAEKKRIEGDDVRTAPQPRAAAFGRRDARWYRWPALHLQLAPE